ncbi:MAG: MFS transporter [Lachnospiraceae bacterium]|jgi:GPH family glycoside/pentoside/hexuronide:cation symporter
MAGTAKEKKLPLSSKVFNSTVKSANTTNSERWLGYFLGPALMYIVYYCVAGTYLTQFYTDVLGMSGIFLTLMPVISKIIDAITNIVMGRIIDRTRTAQGKARPWILLSGVLVAVTGILLYTVPRSSYAVQIVWIAVSYNLFFAFAFTIYNMSHTLMVPLSTRNYKQRDTLALLTNTGSSMIPGMLVTVIMPLLISRFGVGSDAQGNWITMMSTLSIFAIPASLIEYYFTKERITEDSEAAAGEDEVETVPFRDQMRACFKDPYWLIIMGFFLLYNIGNYLQTNGLVYYCNWVLANSVESGAGMQVLVNVVGQAPLGVGVFVLWPVVRKFGKRRTMMYGLGIGAIGCVIVILGGRSLPVVLGGLLIKSVGALPTYMIMAMLAEALDHIEWTNGFRADGLSASIYSIILTVSSGIGQSLILGGISLFGYITPGSSSEVITQPAAIRIFFIFCFAGGPLIAYLVGSLLMIRYDVEDKIPQISADITARHKAEAEAKGLVYVSPEEKARREQEENDRIAEEKRIEELKEKCAKKGLNFDEEEAKYQAKAARKQAKKDARAAKK